MSVARVKTSKFAARKGASLKCQRCLREIARGETYRWEEAVDEARSALGDASF